MKEKLPHATTSLVLGIISIVTCCFNGIPGIIFGGIGLYLSNKAIHINAEDPDAFDGIGNAKAGKIISIIGLILGVILFAFFIYLKTNPELLEQLKTWAEEQQANQ